MRFYNKPYILAAVLLLTSLSLAARPQSDSTQIKRLQIIYDEVKKEFAPDGRTAWFKLEHNDRNEYVLETTEKPAAKSFQDKLIAEGLDLPLTLSLLPDTTLGEQRYGLVNLSVVNLRSTPRHSGELATQALLGTPLDILKKSGGYYLVRTPDAYLAWLDPAAISLKTYKEMEEWRQQERLIFTADYGHGFTAANDKSQRVSDLVMGNILVKTGKSKGYYQVSYPDGRRAYISTSQVTEYASWLKKAQPRPEKVIEIAKTMLGVPYLWGGTSIKGVDCSGFTKTSFFMNGLIIPRDASQQVLVGEPIEILKDNELDIDLALKNLQPGDLLFFAGGKNQAPNARVTHVALYLGEGSFIHSAGTVRINSIRKEAANYDDFQSRTIVAARRYAGQIGQAGLTALSASSGY
ncbi:C40 family peptidase [Dyadobacter tibetensis]|uniref:C40 family peptidase n=1 Tax=Dyadobacter tibetensis TaxID=1211851 RepID=UPI0004702618|nr:C40 family peptidase [Dyadobacter tibetensis]